MAKPLTFTMPLRFSSSTGSAQFSKATNYPSMTIPFASDRTKISLKIRFERKEKDLGKQRSRRKQKPRDQNAQIGGLGFAVLGNLKTDLNPKSIIENIQMNNSQNTKKNEAENTVNDAPNKQKEEGEKAKTVYKGMNDYKDSVPKDSESLGASTLNSNDDPKLNPIVGTIKPYQADNTVSGAPNKQKSRREKTEIAHRAKNDYKGSLPKGSESLRASTLDGNDDLNLNSIVRTRKPSVSGEDILMALQRASTEKAKKARRNRRPNPKVENRVESRGPSDVLKDFGEIRPIDIKSEWVARIESLEKRLKELKEKADLT